MREIVEECTEPCRRPWPQEDAKGAAGVAARGEERRSEEKEIKGRETEEERRELRARVCSVGPRC